MLIPGGTHLLLAFFFHFAECDIGISCSEILAIDFAILKHLCEILIRECLFLCFAVVTKIAEFEELLPQCSARTLCAGTALCHGMVIHLQ